MRRLCLLLALSVLLCCSAGAEGQVIGESGVIACVGDSITFGHGVWDTRDVDSWPARLQMLLGDGWQVGNFGVNAATATSGTGFAYNDRWDYWLSLQSNADVYILLLGTNDAKAEYWDRDKFCRDYSALIERYLSSGPDVQVWLAVPPAVYPELGGYPQCEEDIARNLAEQTVDAVVQLAEEFGLPLIDLYSFTADAPEWYTDSLHPNAAGNTAIAEYIYTCLTGREEAG